MAPEMAEPGAVTPLVDVYALGVTLYQMLSGELPYQADTPMAILIAHVRSPVPDIRARRPDLPPGVQAVIQRALAKDPAERYPSAGALAAALRAAPDAPRAAPADRAETLREQPAYAPTIPEPVPAIQPPETPWPAETPAQPYAAPPAAPPYAPRREPGRRTRWGLLLAGAGIVGGLGLVGIVALALLLPTLVGPPATPDAGSAALTAASTIAAVETAQPGQQSTPQQQPTTDTSSAASTPTAEPTHDPAPEIADAVQFFDQEMRYLLETGDTSRMAQAAAGDALSDRLNAADILRRAGDCHWRYDHRGLDVQRVGLASPNRAVARAMVDRDGTVFCGTVERSEYAFDGPYPAIYVVEYLSGRWIVTDYCAESGCPPEMLDEASRLP